MLGPMEYNPITIISSVDYNRSITHTYIHTQSDKPTCVTV